MTSFENTYQEFRKYEIMAENAMIKYEEFHLSAWKKQAKKYTIQANKFKQALDSQVALNQN